MAITKRRLRPGSSVFFYQAEVSIKGKRVASKAFPTRSEAKHWHDETKEKFRLRTHWSKRTVAEIAEIYRTKVFHGLRKSSQQAKGSRFTYIIDSPFGNTRLEDLNPSTITDWILWLKEHPTAQNPTRFTFAAELKMLGAILRWHQGEHDVRFVVPITPSHRKAVTLREKVRDPNFFLTEDEVRAFIEALKQRPDPIYGLLGLTMVLCSFGIGEAAGLCWDAVGFGPSPFLKVIRTITWDYSTKVPSIVGMVKNDHRARVIRMSPILEDVLRAHWERCGRPAAGPIFLTKKGRLLSDNAIRANFNKAFKACGLKWTGTHIMRHTFATIALNAKKDVTPVQHSMGHSTSKQTNHYAKVIGMRNNDSSIVVGEKIFGSRKNHVIFLEDTKKASHIKKLRQDMRTRRDSTLPEKKVLNFN